MPKLLQTHTTRRQLPKLLFALASCYGFTLADIVAVDRLTARGRFAVKYLLLSHPYNTRLTVTVFANELLTIPSARTIFPSAGWLEREV